MLLTGKHAVQVHGVQALLCGAALCGGGLRAPPGEAAPAAAAAEAAAARILRAARVPWPWPTRQLCSDALLQGRFVCQQASVHLHSLLVIANLG
jgi:hypothetical protein